MLYMQSEYLWGSFLYSLQRHNHAQHFITIIISRIVAIVKLQLRALFDSGVSKPFWFKHSYFVSVHSTYCILHLRNALREISGYIVAKLADRQP